MAVMPKSKDHGLRQVEGTRNSRMKTRCWERQRDASNGQSKQLMNDWLYILENKRVISRSPKRQKLISMNLNGLTKHPLRKKSKNEKIGGRLVNLLKTQGK